MTKNLRFQDSLFDALVDLTPDHMIGGVVLGLLLCLVTAHLYALWSRREPKRSTPSALSAVMLVPVLTAMVLCLGYDRYRIDQRQGTSSLPSSFEPRLPGSNHGFGQGHHHAPRFGRPPHWSFTRPFFDRADANHDGQLSSEEAAQFIQSADTDGDGQIGAETLESMVRQGGDSPHAPSPPPPSEYVAGRPRGESKPGS